MVPELAMVMLACARIGAVHSVVFAGFSSDALRERIVYAKSKWGKFTTSSSFDEGGGALPPWKMYILYFCFISASPILDFPIPTLCTPITTLPPPTPQHISNHHLHPPPVFVTDEGKRGGRTLPLKKIVDDACTGDAAELVKNVFVFNRTGVDLQVLCGARS
jgi:acyl-coenzyme A synthetase/AMP-(fatty) acid ligase